MRRVLVICAALIALAVPAGALALRADDGTLAVRNAAGDSGQVVVWLNISGAVIGQMDSGRVLVDDLSTGDDLAPVVTGAERTRDLPSGATAYSGTNIRFRAVGGHYWIRVAGKGIDVNVVGQGQARLAGVNGRYSLNGGPWTLVPLAGDVFRVGS
jgi:hypothetical protein